MRFLTRTISSARIILGPTVFIKFLLLSTQNTSFWKFWIEYWKAAPKSASLFLLRFLTWTA